MSTPSFAICYSLNLSSIFLIFYMQLVICRSISPSNNVSRILATLGRIMWDLFKSQISLCVIYMYCIQLCQWTILSDWTICDSCFSINTVLMVSAFVIFKLASAYGIWELAWLLLVWWKIQCRNGLIRWAHLGLSIILELAIISVPASDKLWRGTHFVLRPGEQGQTVAAGALDCITRTSAFISYVG